MIDPRALRDAQLLAFDPSVIGDHFDDDEPLELESMLLEAADLSRLAGVPVSLDRCLVVGCDLSAVPIRGVKNSLISDSKLRGTSFRGFVRNVVFESCQLNECVLRMLRVEDVTFASCDVLRCDFYGSEFVRVGFPKSAFAGVGFDQCTIEDVDLSGASDLQVGDPRTLRGVALRETQVPLIALRLAELSGIEIHEG